LGGIANASAHLFLFSDAKPLQSQLAVAMPTLGILSRYHLGMYTAHGVLRVFYTTVQAEGLAALYDFGCSNRSANRPGKDTIYKKTLTVVQISRGISVACRLAYRASGHSDSKSLPQVTETPYWRFASLLVPYWPPFPPSIDIAAHLATDKHTALTLAAAQCATGILNTLPRAPLRCALLLRVNLGEQSFFFRYLVLWMIATRTSNPVTAAKEMFSRLGARGIFLGYLSWYTMLESIAPLCMQAC
jgi:hypothetical protein